MNNVELFHYLLLLICGAGTLTWLAGRMTIAPAVVQGASLAPLIRVLELVGVSRKALPGLHRDGKIDDTLLHRIESELDLEELPLLRLVAP